LYCVNEFTVILTAIDFFLRQVVTTYHQQQHHYHVGQPAVTAERCGSSLAVIPLPNTSPGHASLACPDERASGMPFPRSRPRPGSSHARARPPELGQVRCAGQRASSSLPLATVIPGRGVSARYPAGERSIGLAADLPVRRGRTCRSGRSPDGQPVASAFPR
jgi:hypothetical protein